MSDQICKNQKYFLADIRLTNLTILQVMCVIYANPAQYLSNLANAGPNLLHICKWRAQYVVFVQMQDLMCRICANARPNVSHLR